MDVNAGVKGDWFVIKLEGAFVVRNIRNIRTILDEQGDTPGAKVAIDLSNTNYIDSSAITLLVNFNKRIKSSNGEFVVFGANDDIKGIFSIVNLEATIDIRDSLPE